MEDLKSKAIMDYKLQQEISYGVARLFDNKLKDIPLYEYYPELFEEEVKKANSINKLTQQEINMINYAKEFNKKFNK